VDTNSIGLQIANGFSSVIGGQRDVEGSIADVKTSLTGQNFTTLQSLNDGVRDVIAKSTSSDFQNLNSFNNVVNSIAAGFTNANDRQQNATNLIISQGRDLAAQVAECCCEIKGLVRDENNATRTLICENRMADLEAKLAKATQAQQTADILAAMKK